VKVDCHFYPDSGLKSRWVRKEIQANNFGSSGLQSNGANGDRPISEPMVRMEDSLLDLTLGLSFFPNKESVVLASSAFPSSHNPNQAVASSAPSKSPPPKPNKYRSTSPAPPPSAADRGALMANFAVDPAPFIPGNYQVLHVDGRPQQCRSHVAGVIRPRHEDLAIATIQPDFPGDHPFATTRHFELAADGTRFTVTNIYAPCDRERRDDFLSEIQSLSNLDSDPWLLVGDFNIAQYAEDRNNDNFDVPTAASLNELIDELAL
jgi:hypothetical protein